MYLFETEYADVFRTILTHCSAKSYIKSIKLLLFYAIRSRKNAKFIKFLLCKGHHLITNGWSYDSKQFHEMIICEQNNNLDLIHVSHKKMVLYDLFLL